MNLSLRPLRDTQRDRSLFVDREWELDATQRLLLNNGNVLLLGVRGGGKSSFLRFLSGSLREHDQDVVVLDGRASTTAAELIADLRDRLGAWPTANVGELAPAFAAAAGAIARGDVSIAPPRREAQLISGELRALRDMLARRNAREAIVLLDELPSESVGRLLFGQLRDELWELPLTWCVATDTLARGPLTERPADAFWTRVVELEPMTEHAAADLLRRRLSGFPVPDELIDRLVRIAGSNPRELLLLANRVIVEGQSLEAVVADDAERRTTVAAVSDAARRVLVELETNGAASPSDAALQRALGLTRPRLAQLMKELELAGLVTAFTGAATSGRPRKLYEAVSS